MRASADVTKKDKDTAGLNRTVLGTSSVATSKPGSAGLRKKPEDKGEQKSTGAAARVGSAPHSAGPRKQLHTGQLSTFGFMIEMCGYAQLPHFQIMTYLIHYHNIH
jgi:hypothetical protein